MPGPVWEVYSGSWGIAALSSKLVMAGHNKLLERQNCGLEQCLCGGHMVGGFKELVCPTQN